MIIALDVHYKGSNARAVGIEFEHWDDPIPDKINKAEIRGVAGYEPGAFYKRELPCILEVLKKSDLNTAEVLLIDGYVILNDEGKLGLGGYLYQALKRRIPVIGVAKTRFHGQGKHVKEVIRGRSSNPLYVSSIGINLENAADHIRNMHGVYRIPSLLKILDKNSRE